MNFVQKSFKSIFFILSCVILNSVLCAHVPFAKRENIEKKRRSIVLCRKKGCMIDCGLGVTATVLCTYFGYKILKAMNNKGDKDRARSLSNRALTKKMADLERKFSKHKEPNLLTKRWFKGLAKGVLTSFASSGLAGLGLKYFEKFYYRYHCFSSLQDFIANRFKGLATVDELLYNAQLFDHYIQNEESQVCRAKELFIVSLNNIVNLLEHIIAFMEYKINVLDVDMLTQEDVLLSGHFFDCINEYCARVSDVFEDKIEEKLFLITANFKDDLLGFIESFKGLEDRVTWEFV